MLVLEVQVLLDGNFGEGIAGFVFDGEDRRCREVVADYGRDIEQEPVDVRTSFNSLK